MFGASAPFFLRALSPWDNVLGYNDRVCYNILTNLVLCLHEKRIYNSMLVYFTKCTDTLPRACVHVGMTHSLKWMCKHECVCGSGECCAYMCGLLV